MKPIVFSKELEDCYFSFEGYTIYSINNVLSWSYDNARAYLISIGFSENLAEQYINSLKQINV